MATTPHHAPSQAPHAHGAGGHQHDAPHVHGTMDISAHERGFAGFVRFSAWAVVLSLAVLIFLALANA